MRRIRYAIHFMMLFLVPVISFCQILFPLDQDRADSLRKKLPMLTGKEKVDALNSMSMSLLRHYSWQSDSLAGVAIQLAEEMGYREGRATALFLKGTNDYLQGDFIPGLNDLYDALDMFTDLKDTAMIIDTYYQIGLIIYFTITDTEDVIEMANTCLEYSIASGNWVKTAQMYSSLQYIHGIPGDSDKAMYYLALYDSVVQGRKVPLAEASMIKGAWARSYAQQGKFDEAARKYRESLAMVDPAAIEERAYISQAYYQLGGSFLEAGRPDSASFYFRKGQELSWRYKHYFGSMINLVGLARLSFLQGDYGRSKGYIDSVLFYGNKIDSSASLYGIPEYRKLFGMSGEIYLPLNKEMKRYLAWTTMAQAYRMLFTIYETRQQYKDAYFARENYGSVKDSITGFIKRKELLDIQYKYQARQKDDKIQLLSQENELQQYRISQTRLFLIGGLVIVLMVFLILLLYIRQGRMKSAEQLTEFKQKLFRSQMNPHFIFNSLTSIQNFIINQDDINASVYLSRFSELVRSILNNSMVENITLEEEVSTIENYLELQKVRFSEKFDFSVRVYESLDPGNTFIPPMLGQPFIENAIEHGIKNKAGKGHIQILFEAKNGRLLYSIEDDGVGRQKAREILNERTKEHRSVATDITKERIRVLNRKQRSKITLDIDDLIDRNGNASGTRVTFTVALPGRPARA